VLVGDKDAASPTKTIGLCTALDEDEGDLYFAFLSNEKTLRAEATNFRIHLSGLHGFL